MVGADFVGGECQARAEELGARFGGWCAAGGFGRGFGQGDGRVVLAGLAGAEAVVEEFGEGLLRVREGLRVGLVRGGGGGRGWCGCCALGG